MRVVKPIVEGTHGWESPECFFRLQSGALVTRVALEARGGNGSAETHVAVGVEYLSLIHI